MSTKSIKITLGNFGSKKEIQNLAFLFWHKNLNGKFFKLLTTFSTFWTNYIFKNEVFHSLLAIYWIESLDKKYCKNLASPTVIYNQTSLTLDCLYQFDGNKRANLTTFSNRSILSLKVENVLEKWF